MTGSASSFPQMRMTGSRRSRLTPAADRPCSGFTVAWPASRLRLLLPAADLREGRQSQFPQSPHPTLRCRAERHWRRERSS